MEGKHVVELANKTMIESMGEKVDKPETFVDLARVFVVKTDSQRVINIMKNYDTDKDENLMKSVEKLKWECKTTVLVDYLKIVLEFLKKSKVEEVTIKVSNDYPLGIDIVEDNQAKTTLIIAPRVQS